ncbi:MAG: condensation domain-containing protein, partial [Thermoanaerobaculia bacterium]
PELPIQYADFAAWQRSWLSGEELARQVAYWKDQLAGAPPLLELPTDRPRPAAQSFRGARQRLSLPAELMRSLEVFGRREGLTPFMVLMAAFQALLGRYTAQGDVVVGTPIANRTRTEVERLIGFFANTLVFRTRMGDDPAFVELARRVRGSALGAYDHQDLPFEKLVDELHPERDLSYPPLFQVMFILQNAPAPEADLGSLRMLPLPADRGQSPFDLTLTLMAAGESWVGSFEYVTDLFDAATMARWAGHLEVLLRGIAEAPERRVSELPLLSADERRQLTVDWNDTARPWPAGALLHELFTAQAARTPEAVAVSQGGRTLTYRELDERSNRLAHRLRRLGVSSEVRVGLCVERTPDMVTALLGILKAGGAYVPLDPSHPAERLALVIEDSAVPVLVTEEGLLGSLPAYSASIVCLDRDSGELAAESGTPLERLADEESLAYVIYTSGSTGRPKGVQLPHRAVVNFLRAMAERPGLCETDVVPALTTLSFDIAGLEIYLPLAMGGRVEVVAKEEAADGTLLGARLASCGATVAQATPATWRLLLEAGWEGIPGLRVLCGGEALPRD